MSCVAAAASKMATSRKVLRRFIGTIQHPALQYNMKVVVEVIQFSETEGQWTCLGQTEEITVEHQGTKVVMVERSGNPARRTVLVLETKAYGKLVGYVIQNGQPGGESCLWSTDLAALLV